MKKDNIRVKIIMLGVMSWGSECANSGSNASGVYARVTGQLSWIQGQVSVTTCSVPKQDLSRRSKPRL